MILEPLWTLMEGTRLSVAVREAPFVFAAVEIVHVIALSIVFGSIVIVDLRLLGVASNQVPVRQLSHTFLKWTWTAFAVCLVSGSILFMSKAHDYLIDKEFLAKFAVMALAGVNMAVFHFGAFRKVAAWNLGPTPAGAKAAAALSILFWITIVVLGRLIGFTIGLHF